MKNKIHYLVLFLTLSAKIHGQVSDTIFVYDKIIVYDTITVYDTIKVEDKKTKGSEGYQNYFKNNNTVQNSVLALDTAHKNAALLLFNGNDTATIPINSIILSENLKNLEPMKKEILTLAAAALFTNTNFAQENKIAPAISLITEDTSKTIKTSAYSLETIVFQNKKNPLKTYEITLPATQGIRFKNWKTGAALNGSSSWIYIARRQPGIITHIDDSVVTVKYQQKMNFKTNKEYFNELKKIRKEKTLSDEEKENKYFELTYTDSVQVPLALIKSIRFSKFNNKNKKFNFYRGFNEQNKRSCTQFYSSVIPLYAELGMIAFAPTAITTVSFPMFTLLYTGMVVVCIISEELIFTKQINFKRWEIKAK